MASKTQEVIDLTSSPKPEIIELDSDSNSDPNTRKRRWKPSSSRADNKFGLLQRITEPNGDGIKLENGESSRSGDSMKKKRKKKRKKVTIGENAVEEGELSEDIDEWQEEQMNGRKSRRSSDGRDARPPRSSQTLLDRIAGVEHSAEPSAARYKTSEPKFREDDAQRSPRKRKRKEKERDRDQERNTPRSPPPSSRRRSRSPDRKLEDGPPPSTHGSSSSLFFVDVGPAELRAITKVPVPAPIPGSSSVQSKEEDSTAKLLLPAHVSLVDTNGIIPVEILPPEPLDSEEEDYIDYLDYGDDDRKRPGVVRYFDDPNEHADPTESKPRRFVCKNCGAEGEHKTYECPVLICLTCGARDEHSTRSCPISKVCFACGMKGHTKIACPNRYSRNLVSNYDDCDRCGSSNHQVNECPTLWRLYEYVDDAQRREILHLREEKAVLAIGNGGEGYIAPEEWCYNCGEIGHWGDDCEALPHPYDFPKEPSAFSAYNIASGPFFDPSRVEKSPSSKKAKKRPSIRDAEEWADGHGFVLPVNVGEQGKKKEKERMEKRAKELQVDDDEEDWFNGRKSGASGSGLARSANGRGGGGGGRNSGSGGKGPPTSQSGNSKKISFGNIGRDESRFFRNGGGGSERRSMTSYDDLPRPPRETDSLQIKGASRRHSDDKRSSRSNGDRRRDRYDDDYRDRDYSRESYRDSRNGPRYQGGYRR